MKVQREQKFSMVPMEATLPTHTTKHCETGRCLPREKKKDIFCLIGQKYED
jgi:hypothetical protein